MGKGFVQVGAMGSCLIMLAKLKRGGPSVGCPPSLGLGQLQGMMFCPQIRKLQRHCTNVQLARKMAVVDRRRCNELLLLCVVLLLL